MPPILRPRRCSFLGWSVAAALCTAVLLAPWAIWADRGQPDPLMRQLQRLEERLQRIEQRLQEMGLNPSSAQGSEACVVQRATFHGRAEFMVRVTGTWLRFLEVKPPARKVTVGLDAEVADALYFQAQKQVEDALLPSVFRAVPAVQREASPFLLQDRLLSVQQLRLWGWQGEVERLSLRQAEAVVTRLNDLCTGQVTFELPSETQLLVAGRELYDPGRGLLRPCREVAQLNLASDFDGLLADRWQLTRSPCESFGEQQLDSCPEGTYVIKGGTAQSRNALECIPEYRDAVPPTVAAQNTALRLVLVP